MMQKKPIEEKNMDCTVLVTSCFAYKDVLENFELLFQKYWKDCPFPVYLNIDRKIGRHRMHYDKVILSPHKENLIRMRDIEWKTPYVLIMQDDHFLIDKVDNQKILNAIAYAKKYNCGNLRLIQDPKTEDVFSASEQLLEYKPGKAYRISARGGVWETAYLKKFIYKYKDFWEMERHGQQFSCKIKKRVLCTKERVLPIIDAVHKGYYEDFAYMLLQANGIFPERKQMSNLLKVKEYLKAAILDWNPELITGIQDKFDLGYKHKYN